MFENAFTEGYCQLYKQSYKVYGCSVCYYCFCFIFAKNNLNTFEGGVVGWCDGSAYTSRSGASYKLDDSRARVYCACSRCGWGCLDIFTLLYLFSHLFPSLWKTTRYRLKYCLKGPLNAKQPTNQLLREIISLSLVKDQRGRWVVGWCEGAG